jgi:hypothetical protein
MAHDSTWIDDPFGLSLSAVNSGPQIAESSFAFAVTLLPVLLQNCARRHFRSTIAIAPGLFCAFLDMLVFSLLFGAHSPQMSSAWHSLFSFG